MINIGFTGTQEGMTSRQEERLKILLELNFPVTSFHHGDCIGADAQAHNIAMDLGIPIVIHPPTVNKKRAYCKGAIQELPTKQYLDRNKDIVDSVELMFATPKGYTEEIRSGTWSTVRYSRKKRISVCVIYPDGMYLYF